MYVVLCVYNSRNSNCCTRALSGEVFILTFLDLSPCHFPPNTFKEKLKNRIIREVMGLIHGGVSPDIGNSSQNSASEMQKN